MLFPNLKGEHLIGIDTETYDPDLITNGPGWATGNGYLVGVSIATIDRKWYYPLRHKCESAYNYDKEPVIKFLKDILKTPSIHKVGANIMYDIGWLSTEDIQVKGTLHDVQFAEALIDTNALSYSLDSISKRYLNVGKTDDILYQYLAGCYGGNPDRSQAANIYRAPPRIVAPYAEDDAQLPIKILLEQAPILERRGLEEVYRLECDLIPLLVAMYKRGIPVDLMKAEDTRKDLITIEKIYRNQLKEIAGFHVNVNKRDDLQTLFNKINLEYPSTAKGNPSFTKTWLSAQSHPAAKLVTDIRGIVKARSDFIEKAIIERAHNGKIHPSLHPLRSDEGGTITGRFSCSNPNSQQIPSRDSFLAPLIRGVFVPEKGFTRWCKMDHSQIEYRCFAHYAHKYLNDQVLIRAYSDPHTDYHAVVSDILGGKLPRSIVKTFNFGSLYGMGIQKLANQLRTLFTEEEAKQLLKELSK